MRAMPQNRWVANTPLGDAIRLTNAGWQKKILVSHPEFALNPAYEQEVRKAIEDPDLIVSGWEEELLNLRWCSSAPREPKYLCVVYRAEKPVGFIITAFFISRYGKLLRRGVRWQKKRP